MRATVFAVLALFAGVLTAAGSDNFPGTNIPSVPFNDTGTITAGNNNTLNNYTASPSGTIGLIGSDYGGNDHIYQVNLGAGNSVTFTVTGVSGSTDFALFLLDAQTASNSVIDTSMDYVDDAFAEEISVSNLTPGIYYLVIDTYSASAGYPKYGNYTVSVTGNLGTGGGGSAPPVVTVAAAGNPSEAGATGTFTFTANPAPAAPISVNVNFTGGATFGTDYTVSGVTAGVVTIDTSGTAIVTITPIDDSIGEATESVLVTITAGTGYNAGTPASATLSILDNDGGAPGGSPAARKSGGGGGGCDLGGTSALALLLALLALACTRPLLRRE
ncbi:MAG: pre-peptidase C-terminal domain-containing protein [Planctomycetes bacterium]|nr:pre-peptidase C-terminal domain-containing protein [Planctomycetota bacterium]MCW8135427.1 pre-peptidase C-terminal domain-containing protein [Planctomycetota bacterium]